MIEQNDFIYQQWKQNSVKRAYAHFMNVYIRLQSLAQYIAAGGAEEESPDYCYLVTELGEDVLREELGKIMLEMENKNG